MAWRFQPSKFKNTAPKMPKKEETIFDMPIGTLSCTDNGIQSSETFLAFHIEGEGGKLGVLPADARGRRIRTDIDVICAHADQVDDFAFLPFAENRLVTCSRDDRVKVWSLSPSAPASLAGDVDVGASRLLSALAPHSTATDILAIGSTSAVFVADLSREETVIECTGIVEKTMSVAWSEDGRTLAASSDKGRTGTIWDPRAGSSPVHEITLHTGMGREARCIFAGGKLISSGFTNKRVQEVQVWDARSWDKSIFAKEFTATTGVLIPAYDPDTKLLFLGGKGTNKIFLTEIQEKMPILSDVYELNVPDQLLGFSLAPKRTVKVMDGEVARMYQLTKNAILPIPCIVPRRSYRELHADLFPDTRGPIAGCSGKAWLEGSNDLPEKVSLVAGHGGSDCPPPEPTPPACQLRLAGVVTAPRMPPPTRPVSAATPAQVPAAKSAPSQISPPPAAPAPAPTKTEETKVKEEPRELVYQRQSGVVKAASKQEDEAETTSLKENVPETRQAAPATVTSAAPRSSGGAAPPSSGAPSSATPSVTPAHPTPTLTRAPSMPASTQQPEVKLRVLARSENDATPRLSQRVRPKSCVVGQVQSKYRHVETLAGVKAGAVFSNLRNVNTRLPTECNGAAASSKFVAVPLAGPAGIVAILDVDSPQKMPDGVVDGIYNKAMVTDLAWSPFDPNLLAVGTDQGLLHLWRIPDSLPKKEGEGEEEERPPLRAEIDPESSLSMGGEKIVSIRWHPLAKDLLAVALGDCAIELWTTSPPSRRARLLSHSLPVLSFAWSFGGSKLASVGKDLELHVWRPQTSTEALEGRISGAIESPRGARVLFACDDTMIIVVGFTKSSGRMILMYDATSPALPLIHKQHLDNAVQPLVPHYDFDSSVLFLSGKGDRTVSMYEVCPEPPYLLQLSPYTAPTGHQAIAFHNKSVCKVMEVEFARAWRLTEKTLELLRFRVPRVKKDMFQSDLFPDALVSWEPATTADEWLAGAQVAPSFRSLRPEGVSALTLPAAATAPPKLAKRSEHAEDTNSATTTTATTLNGNSARSEPIKEKEVMSAWSAQISAEPGLEQDRMEGVPEEDWKE